jgi:hypothetical protein
MGVHDGKYAFGVRKLPNVTSAPELRWSLVSDPA